MKKVLTFPTVIGFLLIILIAGGCNPRPKPQESNGGGGVPQAMADPTNPKIYLKDTLIEGTMHLFMGDKTSECGVIDDHLVVVKRNHSVKWKNADGSNITEVLHILPVGDTSFWGVVPEIDTVDVESTEFFANNMGVFKLVIPEDAPLDTVVKYEIKFIVGDDTTTIDPYLKLPDQE